MKLICGPMATISHPAFRILIEKFGACDEYFTEMINAPSLVTGGPFENYYLDPSPCPEKIVWQLTSKNTDFMLAGAKEIVCLPGIGIDINMGCSAPEIVKQGAGIAWMLKPINETAQMLNAVRKSFSYNQRLSVKIRLGGEDFDFENLKNFVDMLICEGVTQIVLHPRTQKEKFRRNPKWQYVNDLLLYVTEKYGDSICLCGNGDIKDVESFASVLQKVPNIKGVMIGRSAVQKPWIFGELKNYLNYIEENEQSSQIEKKFVPRKEKFDLQAIGFDFFEKLKISQPQEFWLTRSQRFFTYFCMNVSFSHYLTTQIINCKNIDDMKQAFAAYFEKMPNERFV